MSVFITEARTVSRLGSWEVKRWRFNCCVVRMDFAAESKLVISTIVIRIPVWKRGIDHCAVVAAHIVAIAKTGRGSFVVAETRGPDISRASALVKDFVGSVTWPGISSEPTEAVQVAPL